MRRRNFFAALLGAPMAAKAIPPTAPSGHVTINGDLATEEQRRKIAREFAAYVDHKLNMIESRRFSKDEIVQAFRF